MSAPGALSARVRRSLQAKASWLTSGSLLIVAAVLSLGVGAVFHSGFSELERTWVEEAVRRVRTAEAAQIDGLVRSAKDYASWNETYDFMGGEPIDYTKQNLIASVFANLQLDAFLLFEPSGALKLGRGFEDGAVVTYSLDEVSEALGAQVPAVVAGAGQTVEGLLEVQGKVALFAIQPILQDDDTGPPRGALAHVRYLHEDRLHQLRQALNLEISLHAAGDVAGDESLAQAKVFAEGADFVTSVVSEDLLVAHVPLRDGSGRRTAVWHVALPREIHLQERRVWLWLNAVIVLVVVAAAVVIGRLLRGLVIARLEVLHQAVGQVGATRNLRVRLPVQGTDEIAGLTQDINQMLDALERGEAARLRAEDERRKLAGQLQQAQRLEAIGTLAGGLAHDFNNLLTSIQGSATLLREGALADAAARRHLARIDEAASQGSRLVRQMMAFGQRSMPVLAEVSLSAVVRGALDLLRPSVPQTIAFEVRGDVPDDHVSADAGQLQQVVMNLGTNACHAMAAGTGTLTVRIAAAELPVPGRPATGEVAPGAYLCLEIIDTGCGIAAELLPRVFEPFYTTKPVGSGTGLGLAVAHGIVAQHDGAIGVESEPGRGTTVFVYLPRWRAGTESPAARATAAAPARTTGGRVLLVDDDALVRETLEAALRRRRYEVVSVSGGPEALERLRAEEAGFDCLVTDQMMPGMTGTELGQRVQSERPGLPMVLVTGYAAALNETKVRELGFFAMLMKPVTIDVLDEVVRQAAVGQG